MGMGSEPETERAAPAWVNFLKERYDGASRPCRHALTGRVEAPKICAWNYECYHCSYDQMLDDVDLHQLANAPGRTLASGYEMADGYYYHMGHSWARFEHGALTRIGLDDFARRLFGPLDAVSLPPLGAHLKQDQVGWTLDRAEHHAAVLAPVTGKVLAVNQKALEHPEIVHADPYYEGWLFMVEPDAPKRNLKKLYYGDEGLRWMEGESGRLLSHLGPGYENLAATGAELIGDIFGQFPDLKWDALVRDFLRTEKK